MKISIFLVTLFAIGLTLTSCGNKSKNSTKTEQTEKQEGKTITSKFTVYGNCSMCKKTIEDSMKNVDGVSLAEWNQDTDEMTVSFDSDVISIDDIKQKIADVGYDSDTHRAKDEVYNALPGCCQYDRPSM